MTSEESGDGDNHADEERLGDLLYGLFPDPDADSVEEVREIRER